MTPDAVTEVVAGLAGAGVDLVAGLPDTWQRELHEAVEADARFRYVPVGNEGVGFSLCAGAWLGGAVPALLTESSGLRVAAEWLARTGMGTGIPVLLLVSHRGDIGDAEHWSDPHRAVCVPLLDALRVPHVTVGRVEDARQSVVRASRLGAATLQPTAVLLTGDLIWGREG
jgi:sulfopyruvate decarboxylase subunit alpha